VLGKLSDHGRVHIPVQALFGADVETMKELEAKQ
jgi:hypothetical protein